MGTIDLFRPYMHHGAADAVARVLSYDAAGRLYCGEGPLVKQFERGFAALLGADPATVVAVNSCSSALALALQLAGVAGGEVISTPMTCTATNEAIVNAGARIVWADVDPRTGLLDPADVARKVNSWTRAIMAVNWGGHQADLAGLWDACEGWPVILDAAHGPFTRGAADYTCFSFGPIKHLTCGDGGALITWADPARARRLRWHGLDRESTADFRCAQDIVEPGHKWHMTDLNAAIGLANLPHADWVVARHRQNAAFYDRALAGLPGVALPPADPGSAYWCYFVLVEDRADFQAWMASKGIATSPVHRRNDAQPAYRFPSGPLPGVDHYAARNVAIPVGWWLTEQEREYVANAVIAWACRHEWAQADPLRETLRRESAGIARRAGTVTA